MNMLIAIYVHASNDGNGNPRRGWAIYELDGELLSFVNEGYAGTRALNAAMASLSGRQWRELGEIEITPREYGNFLAYSKR